MRREYGDAVLNRPEATAPLTPRLAESVPRDSRNGIMEYRASAASAVSLRLDASELDHFAPLLGLVDNQLAELGRRSRQRRAAEARPHLGVGKRHVNFLVQLLHDVFWRVPGGTDASPETRFVARHEFSHRGDVWQHWRACRGCHRQRTKFAGPDVFDR